MHDLESADSRESANAFAFAFAFALSLSLLPTDRTGVRRGVRDGYDYTNVQLMFRVVGGC
jgi:hypothetical protein